MIWGLYCLSTTSQVWICHRWYPTEQEAQVEMAKLALKYGGQWRIVKEE